MLLQNIRDIEKQKRLLQHEVRPEPTKVLLVYPDYFEIKDVKNPYMTGHIGKTDKKLAFLQWKTLLGHYKTLQENGVLDEIKILPGCPGLSDMVFCANQSFPWLNTNGEKQVVLSNMAFSDRQKEVVYFENFFKNKGYKIIQIEEGKVLEGMGDLISVPKETLIFGGYGKRTQLDALHLFAAQLGLPVVPLQLISDYFYHLDTCFLPLDKNTAFYCPSAFSDDAIQLLSAYFDNLIPISENETRASFGLNAHIIWTSGGNRFAIIDQKAKSLIALLKKQAVQVIEVDTSEFRKSGGSVFCLKMMYY